MILILNTKTVILKTKQIMRVSAIFLKFKHCSALNYKLFIRVYILYIFLIFTVSIKVSYLCDTVKCNFPNLFSI